MLRVKAKLAMERAHKKESAAKRREVMCREGSLTGKSAPDLETQAALHDTNTIRNYVTSYQTEIPTMPTLTGVMRFRNLVPNLPDVVMRRIFDFLSYKQLCKAECVCRRWQSIVFSIMRRNVHEITIDRVYVNKDERRKYFSNVDELWLLIIDCNDQVTEGFLQIEEKLFCEINYLTLQVHLTTQCYRNVAAVVNAFTTRHPKLTLRLEIHAEKSSMSYEGTRYKSKKYRCQMPRMKRVTRPADGVIKPKIMSETSEKPKNKAHEELVKRLKVAIPELVVNCEDIYYCW
ncbi:F-box domain protein [Teladorsagia circumcincta]|uniref:F-box domain protein n=1 Tax=Teladorsagia circumcincta TaxID=45464 RepID=A0A2G9UZR2_TELCI|nr:F-box domain protein [Teladorsagia circumcincta]